MKIRGWWCEGCQQHISDAGSGRHFGRGTDEECFGLMRPLVLASEAFEEAARMVEAYSKKHGLADCVEDMLGPLAAALRQKGAE